MAEDKFIVPAVTKNQPGTVGRFLEVAKSQIGYIEGPKDNETKFGKKYGTNFQPWCGAYVNWCGEEAGVKLPRTVYTPAGAAAFKKAGQWIDAQVADPEPGDIAYFNFPGVTGICHVGIVAIDNEDGTVVTYEGNTSRDGVKGSQRNGGEAAIKTRAYKKNSKNVMISIVGFGRPKYTGVSVKSATSNNINNNITCPKCGHEINK